VKYILWESVISVFKSNEVTLITQWITYRTYNMCILKMETSDHVANPVNYILINCFFGQIRK
jgi:hypothetical protein